VVPCCTQSVLTTLSGMKWAFACFQLNREQYPVCRLINVHFLGRFVLALLVMMSTYGG